MPYGRGGEHPRAFYKALANPVRRDILSYLGEHGEANSTSVAKALGESTARPEGSHSG
ncbi:hypothetical protein [Streptomyces cucumeris]|uniref:hypothetical protein n=1 Tax=Streptomyces cucumeris TaxID=2962890 RepID=UPI003D7271B3